MDKNIESKLPEVIRILKQYSIDAAWLFGSAATDSMTEESDVDILIRLNIPNDFEAYFANYFGAMHDLQSLLKRDVEFIAEETLSNPFLIQKINSQKVSLL